MTTTNKRPKPSAQAARASKPVKIISKPRQVTAPAPSLLWIARSGYGAKSARTADGAYTIQPQFEPRLKKGRRIFIEFIVSFAPWPDNNDDDPDLVEEEDVRIIKRGVQSEADAKADAQADADAHATGDRT